MKEIANQVTVVKYEANDGTIFNTREDALFRDDELAGKKMLCTECRGEKEVTIDPYGDGRQFITQDCNTCKGKGYLEMKWS